MRIAPPEARCMGCGYSLAWIRSMRCPECGRGFDPYDEGTYRMPVTGAEVMRGLCGRIWRAVAERPLNGSRRADLGWLVGAAVGLCLWQVDVVLGVMGVSAAFGITVLTLNDVVRKRFPGRRLLHSLGVAIGVWVVLNVGVERCPHATYVSVGPMSAVVDGKGCGNPRRPVTLFTFVTGVRDPWVGW